MTAPFAFLPNIGVPELLIVLGILILIFGPKQIPKAAKSLGKGLLMFAPVGLGAATVKICPPLTITEDAVLDGLAALSEAIAEAVAERGRA